MAVLFHQIKMFLLMIIFLASAFPARSISHAALCGETEKQALLSLKQDIIDQDNRLWSWDVEPDCCEWLGVVCNNDTGNVEELRLGSDDSSVWRLRGKINPSLLDVKHLTLLNLSNNLFGTPIPSFLGSMHSLAYLNLDSAGFDGLIPRELGNLSSLRYLSLSQSFSYVENLHWLTGLSSLEYLDMTHVNLTRASDHWISSISKLTSLSKLRLNSCYLLGVPQVSKIINRTSSLESLEVSFNKFDFPSLTKWLSSLDKLVSVDLSGVGLGGHGCSSVLCNLRNNTYLESLDMSSNEFNSTIPACLYGFSNLKHLFMAGSNLRGVISSDIKNLTSIITLSLPRNDLEGKIPSSIGSLCDLESVLFSMNNFVGNILEVLESFLRCNPDRMKTMGFSVNSFSGQITDRIGEFKNLENLYLGFNKLSGHIPDSIGKLSSLKLLYLSGGNRFNGSLPKSLGSLSNLEGLVIWNNNFQGVVSEFHFNNLKNLRLLQASGNSLRLRVNPDWNPPFQLETLDLRSWNLGPSFPMWLKSQKELTSLDISNAGISDSAPSWFWDLPCNFSSLNLSHNHIHGKIPYIKFVDVFGGIYLGSNRFEGQLPRISSKMQELDLSNNDFSGDMSSLLCNPIRDYEYDSISLVTLLLGENPYLSGEIPDCLRNWTSLAAINLDGCKLSGEIPSSIGLLHNLASLHLRNNDLSGELPRSLQNSTALEVLDLGLNKFQGTLPTWIGIRLWRLIILVLRGNGLRGNIPYELCHLANLRILDISHNQLSGSIPKCFNNFTGMATKPNYSKRILTSGWLSFEFIENAYVVTRGREDKYDTILSLMVSLDLSNNNLSEDFPEAITSLHGLFSLNLSGNQLRGNIPSAISGLIWAQSLDFSRNKLTGEIPSSVSNLNFVTIFNVSHNNLSGEIPTATQLQRMETSNFLGNQFLCGPPLAKSCKTSKESTPNTRDHSEGEADEEEQYRYWFRLGIGVGFGVGFLGVISPLLVYPPWRRCYFWMWEQLWYKIYDFFFFSPLLKSSVVAIRARLC